MDKLDKSGGARELANALRPSLCFFISQLSVPLVSTCFYEADIFHNNLDVNDDPWFDPYTSMKAAVALETY